MLEGWRNQEGAGVHATRRGVPVGVDAGDGREWSLTCAGVRHLARSTLRGCQGAIRGFCSFITDPAYGWAQVCEEQFGTHPIQVLNEVNSAAHVADSEADAAKRAFTRDELQALFDHADDQVAQKRARGRKRWLAAFQDATIFKTAYGFGTRRRETAMLGVADFGRNPDGQEFGEYGVCYVRYGKAQKGSPAETTQRADRLGVDRRDPRAVVH
jgi:integrase